MTGTKHEQARFDWNACELGPPPFAPPRPSSDEVTKQVTELETQNQDQDEDEDDEEKEALNQMTDDISEMISIRTRFEIFSNALRAMCGVSGFIKYVNRTSLYSLFPTTIHNLSKRTHTQV